MSTEVPSLSVIGYLPAIPYSPTKLATVYKLMKRSCAISSRMKQPHPIITLDQTVYCKAQQIRWKHPDQFKTVLLCMGGFHTAGIFMAVLGKRFRDAGLCDLLTESGVLAAGSVASVLDGKHYNHGVCVHKVVWEALSRLQWRQFESFLEGDGYGCYISFQQLLQALSDLRANPCKQKFAGLTASPNLTALHSAYAGFCKQNHGPLFMFWSSCISMVELPLAFI